MEQKLIVLTTVSKKALQLGENLCSKADNSVKECKVDVENIEKICPKLKFLWGELEFQVQSVEKLKNFAEKQNGILQQFYANKEQELTMLINELENTLQNLRNKQVDISIRENALALEKSTRENTPPRGGDLGGGKRGIEFDFIEKDYNNKIEEKITLYDYVEEQSVQELKDKTREEISVISNYHNSSSTLIERIKNHLLQFNEMLENNTISFEESVSEFSHDKCNVLDKETHSMAEILVSLARHYDQVAAALKACQSNAEALDISVLKEDTDLIPTIVEELQESLQKIESTSEEVRIRNQIYQVSYEEAFKLFMELEGFGAKMESFINTMKELEADFEKSSAFVDRYLEELYNLNLWYEEFSKSYDYMIMEIDRRNRIKEQHEKIAEEFLAKLDGLYLEEVHQREIFFQNQGRYLPVDLCPPIQEPPIKYDIIPQDISRLPTISNKTLTEAQENLLKYREK
ncbi:autophagy-related protein 17 [Glomus cerebriforme]|uniref:Autophagy-related protein 17 n=1 Tax=Glomus cerebriforme TaxID=658196 RepID=A0A397SD74_9GLOM|nr:autophagy-related protein 17 [Glomus cerebriforme]